MFTMTYCIGLNTLVSMKIIILYFYSYIVKNWCETGWRAHSGTLLAYQITMLSKIGSFLPKVTSSLNSLLFTTFKIMGSFLK